MASKEYIQDFKFLVELEAPGFDMNADDWSIEVKCGNKTVSVIPKSDCRSTEEGWFVSIPADILRQGELALVARASVPDSTFPDGKRDELAREVIFNLVKP